MFNVDITSKWIKLKEPRPLLLSFLLSRSMTCFISTHCQVAIIFPWHPQLSYFLLYTTDMYFIKKIILPHEGTRGGEALIFTEINHLILLLCTEAAVPVRLKRKTLLNCLNADSLSTVAWQQLWATRINSFHWLRILKTKGERRWKLSSLFDIPELGENDVGSGFSV